MFFAVAESQCYQPDSNSGSHTEANRSAFFITECLPAYIEKYCSAGLERVNFLGTTENIKTPSTKSNSVYVLFRNNVNCGLPDQNGHQPM